MPLRCATGELVRSTRHWRSRSAGTAPKCFVRIFSSQPMGVFFTRSTREALGSCGRRPACAASLWYPTRRGIPCPRYHHRVRSNPDPGSVQSGPGTAHASSAPNTHMPHAELHAFGPARWGHGKAAQTDGGGVTFEGGGGGPGGGGGGCLRGTADSDAFASRSALFRARPSSLPLPLSPLLLLAEASESSETWRRCGRLQVVSCIRP
jgi:hypothetical protein